MYKNNIYISTYFKEYVIKITIDNNDWPAINQRENTRSERPLRSSRRCLPRLPKPYLFYPKPPPNDFFWVAEEKFRRGGGGTLFSTFRHHPNLMSK